MLQNIYDSSPVILQNVYCSIYGLKLYRERYTGGWQAQFNYLNQSQYFDEKKLERIQLELLKKVLSDSVRYVPFYKDSLGITIDDIAGIKTLEALRTFPIIEKEDLRESADRFLSTKYSRNNLVKINTSGTSGTPLTINVTPAARQKNYAFFARSKQWAGINGFERSITLAGRTIVPNRQSGPPFWRKNLFFNNTLFSSYHISENNLKYYINEIRRIRPKFIDSYPSSISYIADYCIKNGITDISVKAIITSAETLLDHQRKKIEEAFNCIVYDQYGSAEQAVFACQCEKGTYHVNPEFGILEVVDKKNNPVKPGEVGEFVCTGFTNDAMPMIRYKIGDLGIISNKKCECGRKFPVIDEIIGRVDDTLVTPDGRFIGRLDPIFKGIKNTIKETQIVQEAIDKIIIKIVKMPRYEDAHGDFIVGELKKRMGNEIHYHIEYVESIPRTKAGKFMAVVSKI